MNAPHQVQMHHKGVTREDLKRQVSEIEKQLKAEWGVDPVRSSRFVDGGDNVVFTWTRS